LAVKVVQTADPIRYKRMMEATSKTAIAYCERHDLSYESFVGIKRGFYGCHATFNRMFMLTELIERGWSDWVLYMDADAYFYDLNFDLREYLQSKAHMAAVMATIDGETIPWHINAGVLMFNLGHPVARELLYDWRSRFLALDESRLKALTSVWGDDNDQFMLCSALYDHSEWRDHVHFERAININHVDGTFIRQYLGAFDADIETRTDTLERAVQDVLLRHGIVDKSHEAVLSALYRATLGRDPDASGLAGYIPALAARNAGDGVEFVLNSLLDSDEGRAFAQRRAATPSA
jgi:hypothetical protein